MSTAATRANDDPIAWLRQLNEAEMEAVGQQSLVNHLVAQAVVAHVKYGELTMESIERLLQDPECTRYPTRIVFEFGEMAMHQFGQVEPDWREPEKDGRVIYLRPALRERPDYVAIAVAYLLPTVNYGEVVGDEHCLRYGAALFGELEDEFYRKVCAMADWVGADTRFPGGEACGCPSSSH